MTEINQSLSPRRSKRFSEASLISTLHNITSPIETPKPRRRTTFHTRRNTVVERNDVSPTREPDPSNYMQKENINNL